MHPLGRQEASFFSPSSVHLVEQLWAQADCLSKFSTLACGFVFCSKPYLLSLGRKDTHKLEAGASTTSVVAMDGPGTLNMFDGRTPRTARLEYVPSKLLTDVEAWGIDYVQITDQRGHRFVFVRLAFQRLKNKIKS